MAAAKATLLSRRRAGAPQLTLGAPTAAINAVHNDEDLTIETFTHADIDTLFAGATTKPAVAAPRPFASKASSWLRTEELRMLKAGGSRSPAQLRRTSAHARPPGWSSSPATERRRASLCARRCATPVALVA